MAIEQDPQTQRRRLRFRSWHRGTREADLILGRFADRHLAEFSAEQLDRYAALLEKSDPDIFDWIAGRQPVPSAFDNDIMRLLKDFRVNDITS
ncbi:MAG: succinate dehydrogenase assembly factor 2 [Dongiaceae bacterium]